MFLKNCWYVAAWSYELPEGEPIARVVTNVPIVLYRHDGSVVALEDRCAHRAAPLSKGRLENGSIRCMYHGFKYGPDGRCTEVPGQSAIPGAARVRNIPVVEKNSWLWVWMGDASRADAQLIPETIGLGHPDWRLRGGFMDYAANYELLNDNLTDFSHVSYVHADSFGTTEEFARTRPHVEPLDRGVRIWRWLLAGYRAEAFAETRHTHTSFESYETYDYTVPGILAMHVFLCPEGTAARFNHGRPEFAKADIISERFSSQAVTPTSERTTRYFYSVGPRADAPDAQNDERYTRAQQAFAEDRAIIEAQQAVLDRDVDRPQILTSGDLAPMKFRALIARLLKEEA